MHILFFFTIDCGHSPMQHVSRHRHLQTLLISVIQTCFWNNEILTPIQKHGIEGPGRIAFKKLRILLDRMMLRRTKVGFILLFVGSKMNRYLRFNELMTWTCLLVWWSYDGTTSVPRRKSFIFRSSQTRNASSAHTLTLERFWIVS
jgi:hypothetical protein